MKAAVDSLDGRLTIRLEVLPGETVKDRIELAERCGFDGIAFPGRFRKKFGEEAIALQGHLALPIKTVSLGFEGSLCSPEPESRALCFKSLIELFDFTAALGAKSVNMPPILKQDSVARYPADAVEKQDQLLIDQLPLLGDEAEKRGLQLLIEPVNQSESDYLNTVIHAAGICEKVNHPAIGLTPDFFHMQKEEADIPASLLRAGATIRHIHTAEHNRVEPGPGTLNFRPGFKALKSMQYTGLVEVECRSLSGEAEEVLPQSAAYLRHEWAKA
ncbi:sugar phosphate isomerase/epimerase [Verrucomicrobiales bacterium]|nr:sugar phosphate isomerase/epimerase [Verrucomicrobiales bacterium]